MTTISEFIRHSERNGARYVLFAQKEPRLRRRLLTCLALVLASYSALAQNRVGDAEFRSVFSAVPVALEAHHSCIVHTIYLAVTGPQKSRGLMFVRSMAADEGMLFVYPPRSRISIWMKNTVIPLDVIFLDENGVVINVAADATPFSLASMRAAAPSTYALELNAGQAAILGVAPGQRLFLPSLIGL